MKKQILFLVMILLPMMASAQKTVKIDGIYYKLFPETKEAEVSSIAPLWFYTGDVIIPSTVVHEDAEYRVTSIGNRAFYKSAELNSVSIPNSVTSIGNSIFSGCTGMTSIVVEEGNPKYDSRENCKAIIETASNKLLFGCQNTVIPNGVKSIENSAFNGCSGLTSIIIPNDVTDIGENAFAGCSELTYVTIGSGVTSIGKNAFKDCGSLTKVEIYSNAIVSKEYHSGFSMSSFFGYQVEEYVLGEEVTSIGQYAFSGCGQLSSINIPSHVTNIGEGAFFSCTSLTSITIPGMVTSIGENAFFNCYGLMSIQVEGGNTVYDSRDNCNALIKTADNTLMLGCQNTVIPNTVTAIGDNAFYCCAGLTSISIPNSITHIGYCAFGGCTGLTTINIPNSVTTIGQYAFTSCKSLTSVSIANSVTDIGDYAFFSCIGLTSITIPNSVTNIGSRVFNNCSGLTDIQVESGNTRYDSRNDCNAIIETASNTLLFGCQNTIIPNGVTSIGECAFWGCVGLTEIIIPNGMTNIGASAFTQCINLTQAIITNGVTSIGDAAFDQCYNLAFVVIPNSVTNIGSGAFFGAGLKDVYCYAEQVPETSNNIFNYSYSIATLHVPAGSIDAYSNSVQWNDFKEIVALTDSDPKPTGIMAPTATQQPAIVECYDLNGRRASQLQRGVNIIKMSDGTTKKVFVK